MKKVLLLLMVVAAALGAKAQGTALAPQAVTDGKVQLPVDGLYAVTAYYSYTSSDADRLVTFTLPSPVAGVVASSTPGDKIDSDIPNMKLPDFDAETTIVKCLAPKDVPVYLKVAFPALSFEAGTTSVTIDVSSVLYDINYGLTCSDAIALGDEPKFLALTAQTEPPFQMVPVYTSYTAPEAGWLYLNFQPSVSQIEYASDCDGQFKRLKHEYLTQNGATVGAKAMMEVKAGDSFIFRISGFNAAMVTAAVENPEAGTSCDFPIDITPGEVSLPAPAGDYYYRFTPVNEGCVEITSDMSLTDGFVEVMMDCNGTGSFTVYNFMHLRTWVWDRMEYLIHVRKAADTAEAEKFNVAIVEPMPYDNYSTAETLKAGEVYRTPNFAGEYYYRVVAPAEAGKVLKLTTLATPEDAYTRVNLYAPSDLTASVAKGFDMSYGVAPSADYLLKWTVFDVDNAIPFKIDFADDGASVETAVADGVEVSTEVGAVVVRGHGEKVAVTDMAGRVVADTFVNGTVRVALTPGIYLVKAGQYLTKIMIK
ncbi:MAG: T9SS type A sorting domain-containing protein [[Clostridium] fimetarium]|nr:T9SS type A sorting domain-containing protein [Alistipes timonensis]MCM1405412.1 T9SS type A sorting domain-containing protein [[Clostridium] fimetarium]